MIDFFKTIIYTPLYNFLIFIIDTFSVDAGVAAVILVVLVKFVLYPLTKKTVVTQAKMKEKEGELNAIKEKYKDSQEQALKVMEFYKTNKINPLSSVFALLIQIPVVFSLYYIFFKSGLPLVDMNLLYSFVHAPESISMVFLGILDVSQKSFLLAVLAAGSTYWQMSKASPASPGSSKTSSTAEEFSKMMSTQMKYVMPGVVFFISWQISGIVALYWFVSNIVSVLQDMYIKRGLVTNPKNP